LTALDTLASRYRVILCDIWGVVHDGVALYPGAAARLRKWRREGRTVVLITNAPRTADAVEQQLGRIGLPRDAWDAISTSGEAGIAVLLGLGRPVGFIGTDEDRAILEAREVPFAELESASNIACTGLFAELPMAEAHRPILAKAAARGAVLHCLNPDRIVVRGGATEPCAGALADIFEGLGGTVEWYGKPFATIYRHALALGGNPDPSEVLAVGDSLQTDVLGAARMGFDCLFVSGGIHAGEDFPPDFAAANGLGDWRPIAVLDSLR
jgi:HAD superfamily hydrolase (TIGR01459 family)